MACGLELHCLAKTDGCCLGSYYQRIQLRDIVSIAAAAAARQDRRDLRRDYHELRSDKRDVHRDNRKIHYDSYR